VQPYNIPSELEKLEQQPGTSSHSSSVLELELSQKPDEFIESSAAWELFLKTPKELEQSLLIKEPKSSTKVNNQNLL
jgi:hypothetical protein